jgi:hypothetical protein
MPQVMDVNQPATEQGSPPKGERKQSNGGREHSVARVPFFGPWGDKVRYETHNAD